MNTRRIIRIKKLCRILNDAGFKKLAASYKNYGTPKEDVFFVGWDQEDDTEEEEGDSQNFDSIISGYMSQLEEVAQQKRSVSSALAAKINFLNNLKIPQSIGSDLVSKLSQWRTQLIDQLYEEYNINRAEDFR
jgi:hypothetical protein